MIPRQHCDVRLSQKSEDVSSRKFMMFPRGSEGCFLKEVVHGLSIISIIFICKNVIMRHILGGCVGWLEIEDAYPRKY